MKLNRLPSTRKRALIAVGAAVVATSPVALSATAATASAAPSGLIPGTLLVTTGIWATNANITPGTTQLPPGCGSSYDPCGTAVAPGTYPLVFNNAAADSSFGVTEPIVLDEVNPHSGRVVGHVEVPNSTEGLPSNANQLVTSFSSKSELAINDSTNGQYASFVGYVAPSGALDLSNANTPGATDLTIADNATATYRGVAILNSRGQFSFTETNAFSGDNGRAAIYDPSNGTIYAAGNAGNGANPEPEGVVQGTGIQVIKASYLPEAAQDPGAPAPLASFNVTQLGDSADKSAKDNNYRGLTAYNGNIYFSKGSGSNGVDTVYFLDNGGTASNGVGTPALRALLPAAGTWTSPTYNNSDTALGLTAKNPGLAPTNSDILAGFPTQSAKDATDASNYPFGLWFANPDTLYVADEGSGDNTYSSSTNTYSAAAASTTAGLEKWSFDGSTGQWVLDYTLQNGLNLGAPYSVAKGAHGLTYPAGLNTTDSGTGLPWAPATDGLRNLTGRVNPNGTVTLWAATSTVSGGGDQGADPNALVEITDNLGAASPSQASSEKFQTVIRPTAGVVVCGAAFTPGHQH